jgi:putative hydrolase of the HAD superfamily
MAYTFIIFDLDDTLYPGGNGLMREIGFRIQTWLCDHLGLTWEQAVALRRDYYLRYGTALGGLVAERQIDTREYLAFVHDVPVEKYLGPNPALDAMLAAIPLRKAIYTNATAEYGGRVLQALGVAGRFERIIGIEEVGLRNKPYLDGCERMLALLGAQGPQCILVEDSARNLRPAKALGLTTVLVGSDLLDENVDYMAESVLEVGRLVEKILPPPEPKNQAIAPPGTGRGMGVYLAENRRA